MAEGGVVAFRVPERLEMRHLHIVGLDGVVGPVAAVADVRAQGGKEPLRPVDPLHGIEHGRCGRMEVRGQAVDLLDVEDGIALHERDFPLQLLPARLVNLGPADAVGIDDQSRPSRPSGHARPDRAPA